MAGYVPIDQNEVPESQHTVFVRGFPGDLNTDKIKDFFDAKVGQCTFDFIKVSADKTRLFVAVRFDTRESARDCLNRFNRTEILGSVVEMQWFRDIRRYVSYQQSQGNLPMSSNRGPNRNRTAARSSGYQSQSGRSGGYFNQNGNRGGYDTYNNRTNGGYRQMNVVRTISNRRSRSQSSDGSYHGRSRSRSHRQSTLSRSRSRSIKSHNRKSISIDKEQKSVSRSPGPEESKPKKSGGKRHKKHKKSSKLRSISRSSGELSCGGSPKTKRRTVSPIGAANPPVKVEFNRNTTRRQVVLETENGSNKTETERPASVVSSNPADSVLSDIRQIQNSVLESVRTDEKTKVATVIKNKSNGGGRFKLSSFTKQFSAESEREKKIGMLTPEKQQLLSTKRKELDLNYKQDCETFGTVTKMLISKDESLETAILNSLREALKDIGGKFVNELDAYIDQLLL